MFTAKFKCARDMVEIHRMYAHELNCPVLSYFVHESSTKINSYGQENFRIFFIIIMGYVVFKGTLYTVKNFLERNT